MDRRQRLTETPHNAFLPSVESTLDRTDLIIRSSCRRRFYQTSPYGRPSVAGRVYFPCLLIGDCEGLVPDA
jgi:hypothetical protein